MTNVHKEGEYKHEGTVEAVYLMKNMTVEVIADGIHDNKAEVRRSEQPAKAFLENGCDYAQSTDSRHLESVASSDNWSLKQLSGPRDKSCRNRGTNAYVNRARNRWFGQGRRR